MDLRKSQVFQWKNLRLEPHKSWDIKIFFFHVTLDVWNQFIFNVQIAPGFLVALTFHNNNHLHFLRMSCENKNKHYYQKF